MSETAKNPFEPVFEEIRRIVKEEIKAALSEAKTVNDDDRMLDVHEAAAFLHYSEDWLYRHWKKIGGRKIGAKGLRFSRRELERWAASRKSS